MSSDKSGPCYSLKSRLPSGYHHIPQKQFTPQKNTLKSKMNEPQVITFHSLANPDGPGVPVYGQTQVLNGDDIPLANYTRTCIKLRLVPVGIPSDLPGVKVANPEKLTRQQLFDKACAAVSGWCITLFPQTECGFINFRIVSLFRKYDTNDFQIEIIVPNSGAGNPLL